MNNIYIIYINRLYFSSTFCALTVIKNWIKRIILCLWLQKTTTKKTTRTSLKPVNRVHAQRIVPANALKPVILSKVECVCCLFVACVCIVSTYHWVYSTLEMISSEMRAKSISVTKMPHLVSLNMHKRKAFFTASNVITTFDYDVFGWKFVNIENVHVVLM